MTMSVLSSLQLTFSKEIALALERTGIGKVISINAAEEHDWELLEVDIEAIELPQYPIFPVKSIERIKIKIANDCLPVVFCRQDFPLVPHLNVYENGDKTLCLFDVPFHDIKYMFNASMFVNRIVYWFSKTARGELHQSDQPLEPFFPSVHDAIILNLNEHAASPFIRWLDRIKREIQEEFGLSVLSSFDTNMEVTAPLAKKGIMLKRVAEYYHLKPEELVVFGDGGNDISMFQCFPVSFAMKNGVEELKKIAAHITKYTNEEDGVGRTVAKLL